MFTKLYEVRLTFIFDEGGRPKSQIYRVKAKNGDTAILAAKRNFMISSAIPRQTANSKYLTA